MIVEDEILGFFRRSKDALQRAEDDSSVIETIGAITKAIAASLAGGGKLMLAGNGGSAADAQHIAAELLSRFKLDRNPLPAIAADHRQFGAHRHRQRLWLWL
jgi:D-sedoheptulose 7-phosphate isomerase